MDAFKKWKCPHCGKEMMVPRVLNYRHPTNEKIVKEYVCKCEKDLNKLDDNYYTFFDEIAFRT